MTEVTVLGTIEVVRVTVVMLVDTVEAIDNTTDNTAYVLLAILVKLYYSY